MQRNSENIGIVILNYQSYSDTIRLSKKINELEKQIPDINLITCIVDNNSTNESVKSIREELSDILFTESFYLIKLDQNLGYSSGNNAGIRYLREKGLKYIFVMNNDVYIDDVSFFGNMLNTLKTSGAAVVGPGIIQKGKIELALRLDRPGFCSLVCENLFLPVIIIRNKTKRKKLNLSNEKKVQHVYSVSGSCFLIDADKALESGFLFDEIIFLYEEETILGERMFRHKQLVVFNPNLTVIHKHGATITQYYNKKRQNRMKDESFKEYLYKYRGEMSKIQVNIILVSRKIRWFYENIIHAIKMKLV